MQKTSTSGPAERSLARDAGLFLVLASLFDGLIFPGPSSAADLTGTFYWAFFVHAGFTLYDGRFTVFRTVSWVTLILAVAAPQLAAFWGYKVVWGQVWFWLTASGPQILGASPAWSQWLFEASNSVRGALYGGEAIGPLLLLLVLGIDMAAMHHGALRNMSVLRVVLLAGSAYLALLAAGLVLSAFISHPLPRRHDPALLTPSAIMPPWYALPLYAILRAIPVKLGGVIAAFSAMAVPAIWPWMHAERLRTGPLHWLWAASGLLLAADWIALGYLGSRFPEPAVINVTLALAACYFAFFLVWPPLLGWAARRM